MDNVLPEVLCLFLLWIDENMTFLSQTKKKKKLWVLLGIYRGLTALIFQERNSLRHWFTTISTQSTHNQYAQYTAYTRIVAICQSLNLNIGSFVSWLFTANAKVIFSSFFSNFFNFYSGKTISSPKNFKGKKERGVGGVLGGKKTISKRIVPHKQGLFCELKGCQYQVEEKSDTVTR